MKVLAGAVRAIGAIEAAFEMVTTLLVLGIMFVVFGDVMLRYLFNKPLAWAYDLIGLYLMAGVFFLSLSGTYAAHAHVGVDILVQRLPLAWRRVSEMATCAVGIVLFGLVGWIGAQRAWVNWISDDRISGVVAWPTWVPAATVPLGCGVLILRLVYRLVGQTASLVTGSAVVEPVPISGMGVE